ncbi:hypothetical protein DFH29DRAFT_881720 [Suillus ampliporus]|nr:hypothetical protein DFH29DRAFT_881720 [Suillus ampliporus]
MHLVIPTRSTTHFVTPGALGDTYMVYNPFHHSNMLQGVLGDTCTVYSPFHYPNILPGALGSFMWGRGGSPWTGAGATPLDENGADNLHACSPPPLQLAPPLLQHPSAGGGPIDDNDDAFCTPLGNTLDLLDGDFEMHDGDDVDGQEFYSSRHHVFSLDSP